MPSLDDYAGVPPEGAEAAGSAAAMQPNMADVEPRPRFQLPEWIKAETGPGPIEDYIDHPMNFKRDPDLARVLRGLTGMFDRLNYAIIDVVVGILRFTRKKPPVDIGPGVGGTH